MLYEVILLGAVFAASSAVLTGCGKKKSAPSVAKSPVQNAKSPVSVTKSPAKSPAKEKEDDKKEDGDKEKKDETKKEEMKDEEKEKEKEKTKTKIDDDDDKKTEEKKGSDEKEEDGEKKKGSDEPTKEEDKKEEEDKDNGKNKKEILIEAIPSELRFETATTNQKKLRLKNLTDKKLMFKIKSTTTNTFLINPVFGKIEPKNFAEVTVTHRPSAKREDKLVIITSEMLGKEIEMAKTFKQIKTTGAEVTVKLIAS